MNAQIPPGSVLPSQDSTAATGRGSCCSPNAENTTSYGPGGGDHRVADLDRDAVLVFKGIVVLVPPFEFVLDSSPRGVDHARCEIGPQHPRRGTEDPRDRE